MYTNAISNRQGILVAALCLAVLVVNAFASLQGFAAERGLVRVQVKDLNLNTPVGVQQLYRRLQVGSAQACGPSSLRSLERYSAWKKCYTRTLQDTVDQINTPALVALHKQHRSQDPHG